MRSITRRAAVLAALGALLAASCSQLNDLPTLTEDDLELELAESSKVYAADGTLITTLHGEQDRTIIPLTRIPKHVQNAVIAIEDERYWDHEGVDWKAVLRALLTNITSGEIKEGGSTITQQYVKNVIIAPGETAEKTLERKIREAALARQLEKRLSKEEILERYLNTVYFGHGAYGIQAAAKTYFGTGASDLSLGQGALIAGLIRAPEDYDPYDRRRAALKRRNIVLDKMVELDWADPARAAAAKQKGPGLQPFEVKNTYPAPYFLDYVQRLITWDERFEVVGKNAAQRTRRLFQGGLRIYTTVDLDMQSAAETAIEQVLTYRNDPYGSLVAIEPNTGHIKAMVGGRDYWASKKEDPYSKLNLAILAEPNAGRVRVGDDLVFQAEGTGRQAGSAFKPFALVAAIKKGIPLSKQYKAGSHMTFKGADAGGDWNVQNYEGSSFGNKLSLLEATVNSVNVVYAQLILEVGPDAVVDIADAMGINTDLNAYPSAVLGSNEVNPLGMASGYGTLAADGTYHPPVAITKIVDATGEVIYRDQSEPEEVLEPAVTYLATSALEQVVLRGTAAHYGQIGRPVAGKTGTAQEWRDAWFVGYTPDLVAAVWVGYPGGQIEMKTACSVRFIGEREVCRPTRITVTGGSWPTQIWQAFMLRALVGIPASNFPAAGSLVTVTIDTRNGCLASKFTPPEFRGKGTFAPGTAPKETCREPGDVGRVPDVFGFPVEDAVRLLRDEGFVVEQVEEPSNTYPPGRVIGQSPAGGERAAKGSTVIITVSVKGKDLQEVPDVLGLTRPDAEKALKDAGFEVAIVEEAESDPKDAHKRRGRVWKQSPGGGTEAEEGSTVTIWVNP
ncbi:MAG: transglycosylase domain-containing protein, partial [Actinomycetota bacterium]